MPSKDHTSLTNYIIAQVEAKCTRTTAEEQRVYAIGFLASYIASKIEQDPYILKELKQLLTRT